MNTPRSISSIAREIEQNWKKVPLCARQQLDAMKTLESPKDRYYSDQGYEVINSFLVNAASFRGEAARQLKQELKDSLKFHGCPC